MEVKQKQIDMLDAKPVAFDENMRDYSKDPTFIRKREEAIKFLKKAGLPKWLKKKK